MVEADLRGWLPVMGVALTEDQIARIVDKADDVLGSYSNPVGEAVFETSAHIISSARQ